jgi:2-keto-4-pentenoate hydratase
LVGELPQKVIWRQAPQTYKNEDRTFKDGPRVHFEDTAREYTDYINYYALAPPSSCIGWKVGLTAPVIQQQFGVHEPVFACLLALPPPPKQYAPPRATAKQRRRAGR